MVIEMPKLLLYSDRLRVQDNVETGDIIQWVDDVIYDKWAASHPIEAAQFDVVSIKETKTVFDACIPKWKKLYKSKTTDWSEEKPDEIDVWIDADGNKKQVITNPKYKLCYKDGKISETYSRYEENETVIIDKDGKIIG